MTAYPAAAPAPTRISLGPRYAQMLYTSFDDGSGVGGGWQIKDEVGDLSSDERGQLTARVVTRFDVDPPLPQFPTTDQIANRPARLAYAALGPGVAGYWHTVDAGADATGRPGNVMAHVVLDRDIRLPADFRPIQLWGSPDWRTPYGAAEVLSTSLDTSAPPSPNPELTAQASVHFLIGTGVDRQGVFRVLLDAVYSAMSGGPKVVLLTGAPDTGPKWLAALNFFMSPGTARRLSWTTFDRPEQATFDLLRGVDIVVVPRSEASELTRGDWVVIDEDDEPTVRELGASHTTRHAQIVVTPWSTITEGVLGVDESSALALLGRQDAVAAEVGDYDLSPSWPLAVAVLGNSGLDEFHVDARRAVADEAPAHLPATGPLADVVSDASEATAPSDLTEALRRLCAAHARGGNLRVADQFARIAFTDMHTLDLLPLTEVPQVRTVSGARWSPLVEHMLDELEAKLPDPSGHCTRRLLRLTALLDRLAIDEPDFGAARKRISDLLKASDLSCLAGPASSVVTDQHDVPPYVRRMVLRPALAAVPGSTLRMISAATWRWVMADGADERDQKEVSTPPNPDASDLALYPWFIDALARENPSASLSPDHLGEMATNALLWALEAETITDEECRPLVARLARSAQLDESTLVDVFTRWPHRVTPATAIKAVAYRPASLVLIEVVANLPAVAGDVVSASAIAAARLRQLVTAPRPLSSTMAQTAVIDAAPTFLASISTEHLGELTGDLVSALCAALIAAQSTGQTWVEPETPLAQAIRDRVARSDASVLDLLAELVAVGAIDLNWIVAQAFLAKIETGTNQPGAFTSFVDRNRFDEVVTLLIERRDYRGPRDSQALRDAAWGTVRLGTAEQAESFFARCPKAARDWLRSHRF